MDSTALIARLQETLPEAGFESAAGVDRHATVFLPREGILPAMQQLRDRPDLGFGFLAELTAVDYWPREPRFEVIYILVSLPHQLRLRVKVRLQGADARMPTVSGVWPAANWLEREVWDLFGIEFDGHPDPRRLLMPEDWEGFPLRKDYPVQIQMTPTTASATQMTAEEFRANLEKDRLART